jgi:hypothetical protein
MNKTAIFVLVNIRRARLLLEKAEGFMVKRYRLW